MSERSEPRGGEAELAALLAGRSRGLQGDLDPRVVPDPDLALVPASVLLLLERGAGYRMVFTKRTHSVDHHKGEVSFAGGSADPGDADARATALREAHEEIGLDPGLVTVLGELDELVTVTHFLVTPVVGVVDADLEYLPNPFEVERVLRVPMAHLRDPASWFDDVRTWRGETHVLRSCRFLDDVIWGATSRMLQNFLAVAPAHLLP